MSDEDAVLGILTKRRKGIGMGAKGIALELKWYRSGGDGPQEERLNTYRVEVTLERLRKKAIVKKVTSANRVRWLLL